MTYRTELFLEKNRDYIVLEYQALLSSSKCPFISGLFGLQKEEPSRSSYKFSSVASRFKVHENFQIELLVVCFLSLSLWNFGRDCQFALLLFWNLAKLLSLSLHCDSTKYKLLFYQQQLQALMETLNSTEPHYIRCIKPSSLNCPQKFENQSVLHQLRCGVSLNLAPMPCVLYQNRQLSVHSRSIFIDIFVNIIQIKENIGNFFSII